MAKKFIELQETENLLKRIGAPAYAIHALCLAPSYEAVHRSAYDQCAWERDLAIEQLRNDYGVGLGEKKSADVVEVVRCKDCVYSKNYTCTRGEMYDDTRYRPDYFCADGERRDNNAG